MAFSMQSLACARSLKQNSVLFYAKSNVHCSKLICVYFFSLKKPELKIAAENYGSFCHNSCIIFCLKVPSVVSSLFHEFLCLTPISKRIFHLFDVL